MFRRGPGCGCFGCGGSLLVLLALLGAAWVFVLRPAQDFLAGVRGPQSTQTQSTQTQSTQTQTAPPQSTQPQSAPQTGTTVGDALTRTDVQKFVRVRRKVRDALGPQFAELQTLLTQIQAGQTPNVLQVGTLLRNMTGSVAQARAAQAAALDAEGLTPERYATVRFAVNRALGLPSIDFVQVAQSLQRGQFPDLSSSVQTASPKEKELVAPFARELRATAAAGLLGL